MTPDNETYDFVLEMKVRDYECDLQGIVNNANYQHYYEHTRHEFFVTKNVSFSDMHNRGIDFVVARLTMAFKRSLHPGEQFLSTLNVSKNGVKYVFQQKIYSLPEHRLCNIATTECVALDHGELAHSCEIDTLLKLS